MKMKNRMKIQHWLMLLIVLCVSCKDDKSDTDSQAFDPSKPVVVSDFAPKEGGANQKMIIYGENFGNDLSKIKVTIGGQNARIIGVNHQSLYCIVPAKAYDGDIEVSIVDESGEKIAYAEAGEHYAYQKKMLVSSFLGETYENNTKFDVKDGPFNDCGGFEKMEWLVFDPLNHNHLYVAGYDKSCRLIDFEKKYVSTFNTGIPNPNKNGIPCINWTLGGDMIVTHDQSNDTQPGNYLLTRESGFKSLTPMAAGRGTRAAAVHPINGEYYYAFYNTGMVWRGVVGTKEGVNIFRVPNASVRIFIIIHPTGNYAYIIVNNRQYIMRSDYNWATKNFTEPYLIAGKDQTAGYADGVGSYARVNEPQQGVFVKNPEYEGQEDEYDFYFCDKANHVVRIMTPQGRVSTFAGTPQASGYRDGDLRLDARFAYPAGIAYDEERQCFYIGDSNNRRIRKVAYEE
ncbi:hypothetical protein HMPREF9455_01427 [Dysgonomonas gadei ATCC BAA-286]|jgi:hypothetical protein|uniref:IPT/TIG domain-containing protein n=2 Tax=Dysgonomonadaceae TaxID=2005520 RepID=F5IWG0_9BACT|nr:hypothetical protein HMPREF9455_01427 [Dysgonomonas gadei ATCC BAA-286]MBF0650366.1 IPT/TIG domain-containing protein [Dysgonomonas sp. GY75]